MTRQEAAAEIQLLATKLDLAYRKIEADTARQAILIAREVSSGRFSTEDLRRMGHPYSRRHPNPPADPAIINRQSGRFWRGWSVVGPVITGDRSRVTLTNSAPYADYLKTGTRRMIARPAWRLIEDRVDAYRRARYAALFEDLLG
jgi:hypothetical protein